MWQGQVADSQLSDSYAERRGMDGGPVEFEWNILPGLLSLQILQKIQSDLRTWNIEPENVGDRIIFLSMINKIDWKRGNEDQCMSNSEEIKKYAKEILVRTVGRHLDLETKGNGI